MFQKIELKGKTFDHDFGYSFSLFSPLLKKKGRRKVEGKAKFVIKSHAFPLDRFRRELIIETPHHWLNAKRNYMSLLLEMFVLKLSGIQNR